MYTLSYDVLLVVKVHLIIMLQSLVMRSIVSTSHNTIVMAGSQVQLIDIGLTRIVDINQLWQLPEHFKTVPRQVS